MKTRRLLLCGIVLLVASLVGCMEATDPLAPEAFDDVQVKRSEIRGGEYAPNHPSVVGMVTLQGGGVGICSGTLIAPNLILTAQHCIASLNSEYVQCGQTRFGAAHNPQNVLVTTQPQITQNGRDYFGAAEIHVPPDSNDVCGHDIALVILSGNIPSSQAQPIVPRISDSVFRGENYTALGYGHTGNGGGSGTRRILDNRSVQCEGSRCPNYTSVQSTEFLGSDGTCQGDSGGPALDSQGRVLGALSRGGGNCASSIYSAVFGWGDWMREIGQRAADRGNYNPPAWVETGNTEITGIDSDDDGVDDVDDNCPVVANPSQGDLDSDGFGDDCDSDRDGDGTANNRDNCPDLANPNQIDVDTDGVGDQCDDRIDDPGTGPVDPDPNRDGVTDPDPNGDNSPGGEGFIDDPPGGFCGDGFADDCNSNVQPNAGSVQASCSSVPASPAQAPLALLALIGFAFVARRSKR